MSQFCALLLTSVFAFSAGAQLDIQKQGIDYSEKFGEVNAVLTYWPHGEKHGLFFSASGENEKLPPLEEQCRMLKTLLGRVLKEHPRGEFLVGIGTMRDGLMEPLDRYLVAAPGWDKTRGVARAGRTSDFLVEAVNKSGIADPIKKVFDDYGFTFRLCGVGKMDIRKSAKFKGARLPLFIWEMNFEAKKKEETKRQCEMDYICERLLRIRMNKCCALRAKRLS